MCRIYRDGDFLVFEAPELERLAAYLTLKGIAEELADDGVRLRAKPWLDHVVEPLQELCSAMPRDLLLDVAEALSSEGWLIDLREWIVGLRKSVAALNGVVVYECDCRDGRVELFSTSKCPDPAALSSLGFKTTPIYLGLEASRAVKSPLEAVALYDAVEGAVRRC
ncbi:MAG: hypothetical protein TU35_003295 [Thermoproteus sp. AZ2]|uniref:Uncharacterized protein n=1 Tax=Thermoproteus sp. AZ2 TaxID=1609232 RepID=A0ACC6V022_9CREN